MTCFPALCDIGLFCDICAYNDWCLAWFYGTTYKIALTRLNGIS